MYILNELKRLEKKAEALYKAHNHLAYVHRIINEIISISTIIVSAIITAFLPFLEREKYNITLANSILAFYITLITTLSKSYKPSAKHQQYRIASQAYLSLKSSIRQQMLVINENDTSEDGSNIPIIQDIIDNFEKLRKESPFVSNKIYDKYFIPYVPQPLQEMQIITQH